MNVNLAEELDLLTLYLEGKWKMKIKGGARYMNEMSKTSEMKNEIKMVSEKTKTELSKTKAFAIIYIMLIVFIVFMLAVAIINIVEMTVGYTRSKERMSQRWEALNVGTNLGWSYLNHVFNTNGIMPTTSHLSQNGFIQGRRISNLTNNLQITVYIFDRDVLDFYWGNSNGLNNFINDLRQGGVTRIASRDDSQGIEGPPYLVLTEVVGNFRFGRQGNRIYQLAIIDLENFNRFAYFTHVEQTPTNQDIWFLAGIDVLTGPVHTNSGVVRIAPFGNFYYQNPPGPFVFNGPFSFRGNNNVNNGNSGFIVANYNGTSQNFYDRTFSNGINSVKFNSGEISLPPDDPNDSRNTLRQVWPPLRSSGGAGVPTSQRGIFVHVENGKINSGLYVRDTDTRNVLHSLDLSFAQQNGEVFPKYVFKFDESGTYSTPINLIKKDKEVLYNVEKPSNVTLKVKEYDLSTGGNGSKNLLDILNNQSGYQDISGNYNINSNEKVIIMAKREGNTMYVTKLKLPDNQTFPHNAIWVNGSIGEQLGATNKVGGISGVAAEPITIIAKNSNQAGGSSQFIESIRIKGSIIPYGVNPGKGNLPDQNNKIVIGLYSDIIFVSRNAELYSNLGGENNGIYIYASILAMKDRPGNSQANYTSNHRGGYFMVEDFNNWTYNPNNILHVYGGIIQYFRGPVGTFNISTGSPITGFKKDYRYDPRFAFIRPPLFPTTNRYINQTRFNISFNL